MFVDLLSNQQSGNIFKNSSAKCAGCLMCQLYIHLLIPKELEVNFLKNKGMFHRSTAEEGKMVLIIDISTQTLIEMIC